MSGYMSHEMITPLKCIARLSDCIAKEQGESNLHYLRVIQSTVQLLVTSIKTNLGSTSLKAGQFFVKRGSYRFNKDVVIPVIEMLTVHADVASIKLEVKNTLIGDPIVSVDKLRVQQLLINLIQNAIKFSTKKRPVRVEIYKLFGTSDDQSYLISVIN